MNKIKAVIIEDEYPAARILDSMIKSVRPEWETEILPGNIEEAVEWFKVNEHPDIIFLDIQLTDGNSFMFIEQANPRSLIIFTTAYDEYAVRAFSVNSIDYLLKPVHKERLVEAIEKYERLIRKNSSEYMELLGLPEIMHALSVRKEKKYRTRFLISGNEKFYTLLVSDIAYFYSENKTTFAVTKTNKNHIIDLPLNKLEEQLDEDCFFRVNRQFIFSIDSIRKLESYFLGKAVITVEPPFNSQIIVSREKVAALKCWLDY